MELADTLVLETSAAEAACRFDSCLTHNHRFEAPMVELADTALSNSAALASKACRFNSCSEHQAERAPSVSSVSGQTTGLQNRHHRFESCTHRLAARAQARRLTACT